MSRKIANFDLNSLKSRCKELKEQIETADEAFHDLKPYLHDLCNVNRRFEECIQQNKRSIELHQSIIEDYNKQLVIVDILKNRLKLKTSKLSTFKIENSGKVTENALKMNIQSDENLAINEEREKLKKQLENIHKEDENVTKQLEEISEESMEI